MEGGVRIDKWLWAVRLFKTRSLATDACKSDKVRIAGQTVKPSREIRKGDEINIHSSLIDKKVVVAAVIDHRIGPGLVPDYMIDMTPETEYDKLKMKKEVNFEFRERGLGRPTKLQRRQIESLKRHLDK